jgi:nitroimidazol reductase NimA-like FMN-containing flavoprotein (pyridoxamine 5'-phosphate oxidase superfamily)
MLGILDDDQIEAVLRHCSVGRIGCRDGDEIYVVPVAYAYADGSVYGHCAEGRKLTAMRRTPEVGFEVEDVHGLDDWQSVVATGRFEELHGEEARQALDVLHHRFAPYDPGGSSSHGHGTSAPPVLFRIRLLSSSGRFERPSPGTHTAAPEPRTAYHFEDHDTLARLMRAHG